MPQRLTAPYQAESHSLRKIAFVQLFDNNILTQGTEGAIMPAAGYKRRELVPMVTYADLFDFVIMLCAVITLVILLMKHKK